MGLDSGLTIQPQTAKAKKFMEENFSYLKDNYSANTYEFFYARKCWNIRRRFFDCGFAEDATTKRIYIEDLPTVINKVLKYFLLENNWKVDGDSIWEWYVMVPHIADAIGNLKRFLNYIENDDEEYSEGDFLISFYDSY